MNKQIFYNEKDSAEYIYQNGFTNNQYTKYEAQILAKYFRYVLGYKDTKIKTKIIEFCRSYKNFNQVLEHKSIKKIINNSKQPFVTRSQISITENEIQHIKKIKNYKAQKIYLGLLSLAKKNKSNFISVKEWSTLKKITNLDISTSELYHFFHLIYKNNLVIPLPNKNGSRLLYIDWKGIPVIEIKNNQEIYQLGKIYDIYCGGELGYCLTCNKEFVKTNQRHSYCEEHSNERQLERHRKYNKKRNDI